MFWNISVIQKVNKNKYILPRIARRRWSWKVLHYLAHIYRSFSSSYPRLLLQRNLVWPARVSHTPAPSRRTRGPGCRTVSTQQGTFTYIELLYLRLRLRLQSAKKKLSIEPTLWTVIQYRCIGLVIHHDPKINSPIIWIYENKSSLNQVACCLIMS